MIEAIYLANCEEAYILPGELIGESYGAVIAASAARAEYPALWVEAAEESISGRAALSRGLLYPAWESLSEERKTEVLLHIYDPDAYPVDWSLGDAPVEPCDDTKGSLYEVARQARQWSARRDALEGGGSAADAESDVSYLWELCERIGKREGSEIEGLRDVLDDVIGCEWMRGEDALRVIQYWPALPGEMIHEGPYPFFWAALSSEDVLRRMREMNVSASDGVSLALVMRFVQRALDYGHCADEAPNDRDAMLDKLVESGALGARG